MEIVRVTVVPINLSVRISICPLLDSSERRKATQLASDFALQSQGII